MSASSSWWKTFQQQIHSLLKAICFMFSMTPKSMKRLYMVVIISVEQRCLKVFKVGKGRQGQELKKEKLKKP
jgi:hypothetical protein